MFVNARFTQDVQLQVCTHLDESEEPVFETETFYQGDETGFDILETKIVDGKKIFNVQFGDSSVADLAEGIFIQTDCTLMREYMDADWYEDKSRNLYIVPLSDDLENIGPDNEIMDELNRLWRENKEIVETDIERLKLTRVGQALKRYSHEEGYYHA